MKDKSAVIQSRGTESDPNETSKLTRRGFMELGLGVTVAAVACSQDSGPTEGLTAPPSSPSPVGEVRCTFQPHLRISTPLSGITILTPNNPKKCVAPASLTLTGRGEAFSPPK